MIALAAAALYLALQLALAALAWERARRPAPPRADTARLTVAQAILSGDPRLAAVLEDDLEGIPGAQFLWLVDDDDPAAERICEDLRERHAARRVEVVTCPPAPPGVNPKLHKLELARARAAEPVLLVLDDDTRISRAVAAELAGALADHELATSLPGYLDDGRWPSRLLASFVNDHAALTYLSTQALFPPVTINGMAYAVRRERLGALGGFAPVLRHLTDDLAVAGLFLGAGGRVYQSASVHWVQTTIRDLRHYRQLMHRWFLFALLLLRRQPPRRRTAIALLLGLPPLLLWAALAAAVAAPSLTAVVGVAAALAVRAAALRALQRRLYGRALHAPGFSLAAELLQPLHLAHAALVRRIVWRRRIYRVQDETHFEPAP